MIVRGAKEADGDRRVENAEVIGVVEGSDWGYE